MFVFEQPARVSGHGKSPEFRVWPDSDAFSLARSLRFGCRMVRKTTALTAIAVLTLAVGIGAATRVFTFVNGVVLDSLPYTNPDRLVHVVSPFVRVAQANFPRRQDQRAVMHTLPCAGTPQLASDHGLRRPKGKSAS